MKRNRQLGLDTLIAVGLFVLCLAVYNATLTPSLSYKSPDGNELATVCYTLGLAHSTGYPLYTWLGKLFTYLPVGDVAHRVNLMSAVLGAAAISVLYLILQDLTRSHVWPASHLASAFGALLFGFSLTFWSQTGIAEVYATNLFMVTLTLLLLLRWARVRQTEQAGVRQVELAGVRQAEQVGVRQAEQARAFLWFWAFALVYGLSLGTHLSNLGFAPAFALFVFLIDRRILQQPRTWLVGALLFGLGLLQFLWLPYKANTLNDTFMLRNAPSTLEGIYNYTLGAFPEFKFAFPLQAIPERIVLYLVLLVQNLGRVGILAGVVGLFALLWAAPRRFFLLVGLYLVQVCFFVQYRAFDIDVFFIPAHLIYAIWIGYSLGATLQALASVVGFATLRRRTALTLLNGSLVLLLTLGLVREASANWVRNDYSADTAINDFYENVFDLLPQDSALLGRGGVFGYDMFYFRLVYGYRPDVAIPMIDGPRPAPQELAGRPVYTTEPLSPGRGGGGPWSPPAGLVPGGVWNVPVLLGQSGVGTGMRQQGQPLTLYAAQSSPPDLVVATASPQQAVGQRLGAVELVGYDLDASRAVSGGRLHLTFYWRGTPAGNPLISTSLGDLFLESHPFGLGLLDRYIQEVHPPRDGLVVEDYWLVLPSTLEPGEYPLSVHLGPQPRLWPTDPEPAGQSIELQPIIVVEE